MVLARFLPRDERFFDFFGQAAQNAAEVAHALCDLLEDYSNVEDKARWVRDLERKGDEITHQIFKALYSTFVTPLVTLSSFLSWGQVLRLRVGNLSNWVV